MIIDTLLPKKLDPNEGSYKSVEELNQVLSSAEKLHIKNIALTGPYGSGKSSVLITLREDFLKERNYLPISLATLQVNEEDNNSDDNTNNDNTSDDEKRIENLNRKIEYSILQQLIYREKAKTVPNSRFRRIVHLSNYELIKYPLFVVFSVICFLVLFEPKFIRVESIYNFFCWGNTWNTLFDFIAAGWLLGMLFFIVRYIFQSYSNSKLNKLNLKDAEIEVVENNSIFNRHLDEILYFFQVTKYDVVIIEDLDRFGTPNIFLKLRELNQLINESKIVGRHVTFVYAVKDDIFKDEERTKFFDYIITIIPIINPSNSKDKLKVALVAKECGEDISDDDLSEMAFFIQDMRILTNIVNEYKQYRDKLCTNQGTQLNKTKLLAMIVYKNYYPQDFALLHRREGKIYECISKKAYFISQALKAIDENENNLKKQEQDYERDINLSKTDLRRLFLVNLWHTISSNLISIQIGNAYYALEDIATNEQLFNELLMMQNVIYQYSSGYTYTQSKSIDFKKIDEEINYSERLSLMEKDSHYFQQKYKLIQKERTLIKSQKLQYIIKKYKLTEADEFKSIGLTPMMNIFIRRGYIDEEYYDYISYFYEGMVSLSDRDFLLSIKTEESKPYNYHIDKIENFVKELKEYMFESDAILNIELLDFFAASSEIHKDKFEHIMSRLERDNAPLQFLAEYYIEGKQGQRVFEHYIENVDAWANIVNWKDVDERNNLIEAYLKYCPKLSDDSQKWLNGNFKFLVERMDGITLDKISQLVANSCFDELCDKSDEVLDWVVKNKAYVINLNNLFVITKHLSKDVVTLTEDTLNYTRIIETENKDFIDYVHGNISVVIQELRNINKDDSSESLLYVLNSKDIELEVKKRYLIKAINYIDNFKDIDSNFYSIAIETLIVSPTWINVSFYYHSSTNNMSKILYGYIEHYIEELSKEKYLDEFSYKEDMYISLLGNNTLSIENYKKLLFSFDGVFPKVDSLIDLEPNRWSELINSGKLPFDQSTLEVVNKVASKKDYILSNYILYHYKSFLQHLDWEYNFNVDNIGIILGSKKFSTKEKYDIIEIIPIDVIKDSLSIVNTIVDVFCEEQKVNIDFDELLCLLEKSNVNDKKIELITYVLRNADYSQTEIIQLLTTIGTPYSEVGDKSKRPLLINYTLNKNLLDILVKIGFISSYSEEKDSNMLRIYPTRKDKNN